MASLKGCFPHRLGLNCLSNKTRIHGVRKRRRPHHRPHHSRPLVHHHDSPVRTYRRAAQVLQTGAVVGRIRNSTLGNISVTSSCQHGLSTIIRSSSENSLIYQELSIGKHGELSSQCDVQVIITEASEGDVDKLEYQKPAYVAVALVMAMTGLAVFFPMMLVAFGVNDGAGMGTGVQCTDPCRISLVESIPENLTYPAGSRFHASTYSTWSSLLDLANSSIDIASFYWTLRGTDLNITDPSTWQGSDIFKQLVAAGKERDIKIRIVQNQPASFQDQDTALLEKLGAAMVRNLSVSRFFNGSGILHTKMWIVDRTHVYLGSANMDWRALTQVKELGLALYNCPCMASDAQKLFEVYWYLAQPGANIPAYWPSAYHTDITAKSPLSLMLNDTLAQVYFSSSPSPFCPPHRTGDIDAILDVIQKAQKYVHIAVMDYFPTTMYTNPMRFWPVIDDALRTAALDRHIEVHLLASHWKHSDPDMIRYLRSLAAINGAMNNTANVQVKLFVVPTYTEAQSRIPFARVNHNKYMVTDQVAYVGTSNWSGDYFISTGGVALIVNQTEAVQSQNANETVQQQLEEVFQRDWNSRHAHHLDTWSSSGKFRGRGRG